MTGAGTGQAALAVIGMGPRGLGALESLAARLLEEGRRLAVHVYEPFHAPGAGPNFDPAESPLCLLNIPHRDIAIRPPAYSPTGSFADWLGGTPDPDAFPRRADLGRYLEARFADLRNCGALDITVIRERAISLRRLGRDWVLKTASGHAGRYAEVLLTLGQPKTRPDPQLADWQAHAADGRATLAQAYPAAALQEQAQQWQGRTIAIRGLALSCFDVMRVLTLGQGGRIEQGSYRASGAEPARILPFSLDGKPPFAKPETKAIDDRFTPRAIETDRFSQALDRAVTLDPHGACAALTEALAPVVARILEETGAAFDRTAITDWLRAEWQDPGVQETGTALDLLRRGLALATGAEPPTIGYAVGQVWRKWQDALRVGFNPVHHAPQTAQTILNFDESLKRYSYGPPVSALREMLALVEHGLVDLSCAADPEITLRDEGWRLNETPVTVMIDSVLPAPKLRMLDAPLLDGLMDQDKVCARGDGLAANTAADGSVLGPDGSRAPGLCLLGRLALGSVIAADSLHDCFGASGDRWAGGVLCRIA
ncbi:FAD/NAD(P)-binding protein [Primorskyibacter sp. 2E107]|uniref:FAD/NAD(P)-binding protein n=1 Tax=Primorskyibacter sp. 2E107 TaxID=3403458 RepID=UPI003AF83DDC